MLDKENNKNYRYNTAEKLKANKLRNSNSNTKYNQNRNSYNNIKTNKSAVNPLKNNSNSSSIYNNLNVNSEINNKGNNLNNLIDINYSQDIDLKSPINSTGINNINKNSRRSASENPLDFIKNTNNTSQVLIQKTDKLNNLKEKASDEWAMIVKYNHLKHLEEEQDRKFKIEEKKRKVREILDNQMKEKDHLKKLKQEEDLKFFQLQTENIKNIEIEDIQKSKQKKEKIKAQKEMQERLIQGKKKFHYNLIKYFIYYFRIKGS